MYPYIGALDIAGLVDTFLHFLLYAVYFYFVLGELSQLFKGKGWMREPSSSNQSHIFDNTIFQRS